MLPYLIAGAIGFGIGKLFEEGGETFGRGGMTNEDILRSFLTSNRETQTNNLSTYYNQYDDFLLLRNYSTLIAIRKGNDVRITNIKYSKTTSAITNRLKALAEEMGYNVSYVSKFEGGGEVQDELYDLVSDFDSNEYEAFCYEFDIDIDDANQMTDFISQLSDDDAKNIINQIENGYFSDSEDEYAGGGKATKKYVVKGYVYDGGEIYKKTFDNLDEAYDLAYEIQNGWTDDGTYFLITIYNEKGKKVAEILDDKYFNELPENKLFKNFDLRAGTKKERQIENEKLKGYKFKLEVRIASYPDNLTIFEKTFDSIFDVMDKMNIYYEEDFYAYINNEELDYWEDKLDEYAGGGEAKKRRRRANAQTGRTDRSVDKTRVGKPVGYRFSNSLASKLRKDKYAVPTEKQITKYLGKGIYKENRKNRSDRDKTVKL
jgi:hypothetical protein